MDLVRLFVKARRNDTQTCDTDNKYILGTLRAKRKDDQDDFIRKQKEKPLETEVSGRFSTTSYNGEVRGPASLWAVALRQSPAGAALGTGWPCSARFCTFLASLGPHAEAQTNKGSSSPSALPAARSPPERSAPGPEPPSAGPAGAGSAPEGRRPPSGSAPTVGKETRSFEHRDSKDQRQQLSMGWQWCFWLLSDWRTQDTWAGLPCGYVSGHVLIWSLSAASGTEGSSSSRI